jgi:hypothetical protein
MNQSVDLKLKVKESDPADRVLVDGEISSHGREVKREHSIPSCQFSGTMKASS